MFSDGQVEATPAHRSLEVESTKTMIDRVEKRFGLKPDRLVGDTGYGTAPMLVSRYLGRECRTNSAAAQRSFDSAPDQ